MDLKNVDGTKPPNLIYTTIIRPPPPPFPFNLVIA